jgi:hypothetical protein
MRVLADLLFPLLHNLSACCIGVFSSVMSYITCYRVPKADVNSVAFSPKSNYTDRAIAAGR